MFGLLGRLLARWAIRFIEYEIERIEKIMTSRATLDNDLQACLTAANALASAVQGLTAPDFTAEDTTVNSITETINQALQALQPTQTAPAPSGTPSPSTTTTPPVVAAQGSNTSI